MRIGREAGRERQQLPRYRVCKTDSSRLFDKPQGSVAAAEFECVMTSTREDHDKLDVE